LAEGAAGVVESDMKSFCTLALFLCGGSPNSDAATDVCRWKPDFERAHVLVVEKQGAEAKLGPELTGNRGHNRISGSGKEKRFPRQIPLPKAVRIRSGILGQARWQLVRADNIRVTRSIHFQGFAPDLSFARM